MGENLKVLVPTNDLTFSVALTAEYLRRGLEVHVGVTNFFRREQDFDVIHFQWPEDLVEWRLPTTPQGGKLAIDCLDWWKSRSKQATRKKHRMQGTAAVLAETMSRLRQPTLRAALACN